MSIWKNRGIDPWKRRLLIAFAAAVVSPLQSEVSISINSW